MNARLSHRCTALIDRARAAWLSRPLVRRLGTRKPAGGRLITMELLDLELFRVDIGG
ncbi:hypothetical protein ABMY26_13195 [Azospirillum sp. HJ39]|uniref:hypothetical protein n=1 Tax=Azospirillum sp. HJ39 TaxID=3159496 RepID=UPI0035560362